MPIIPDTKDWTWVLRRPCPECAFDSSSLPREQIAPLIGTTSRAWATVLEQSPVLLRRRRSQDRWSSLEYACHVRDVFSLYHERLQLMLTQDNPAYPNWDQDQTAVDDRYNDQDPAAVAIQLLAAARTLAATFATVEGESWQRRGRRGDGATFTVDTFGRYMIHDPVHHLYDVRGDVATTAPENA